MGGNAFLEFIDVERITRQLRLLNDIQTENLVGCWEREEGEDRFFWSDSMFILHGLPVSPDNRISADEAGRLIHPDDVVLVQQKRAALEQDNYVDYHVRILTTDGNTRRIHARERKSAQNGSFIYRGNWRDERKEKDIQQPVMELNDQQAVQLKVFERAEEVAQVGSWQINLETFETIYSDNVYRIYGLQPQSLSPHVDSFRKFIHPEDRTVVLKTQEKAYVEMIPIHLEYRIIREDGEVRYISQVSHLLKSAKGEHILSGSTRDITEQKLLEIQLRETNEVLSLHNELFIQAEQIGHLGTWQVNINTRKSVYSSNLYRLYGLKPQSVMPGIQNFIQFIHPDDQDAVQAAYTKAFTEQVAPDIEFRITRADGKPRIFRQKSRFIKADGDELLIGVVQDVTDHQQKDRLVKDTHTRLAVQNEAFGQAEKVAGMGSWTWNLNTNEILYSDNVYIIYGLKPQSIPPGHESFRKYVHPDDRKLMKEISENSEALKEPLSVDFRIIRPDGEVRHLRSKSQPIVSPEDHTIIIGTTRDITAEVRLEQQLLEKIRFAETLSDAMVDRLIVTDTSNNIISWNKSCENIYKIKKEDALGRNFFDVLPHAKIPEVLARFKKALSGEVIHVPLMPTTPVPGYQEVFIIPFKDEKGSIQGILHVLHDITRQQQLQQQLSERLLFIEKLLEASVDRIMVLDNDLYFRLWNGQCEKYYGLSREKVIGRHVLDVFPKFKTDPVYQHCLSAMEGEIAYVPPNEQAGLAGYQESYFIPLKNDARVTTEVLWIIHDLTERFIAGQKLRRSENHLKAAQEIALVGSFEMDLLTRKIDWSEQTYKMFNYPFGEDINMEKVEARLHNDDVESVREVIGQLEKEPGQAIDAYFRMLPGDGSMKYFHVRMQSESSDGDKPDRIIGTMQDITEKRISELQNRKQQELLSQAEEIAHLGSWEFNPATKELNWSDEVFRIYGYAPKSFEPNLDFYIDTTHASDKEQLKAAIHLAEVSGEPQTLSCRILTVGGEMRQIQTRIRPVREESGNVSRIIATMQDITEQTMLKDELRRKNDAFRLQYELDRQSERIRNFGSWQWNIKTGKMIWGEHFFRMVGLEPYVFDPTIESFIELMHPDDREKFRSIISNISGSKADKIPDFEFRLAINEKTKYLRLSGRIVSKTEVIGSVIDITDDTLLRQQLAERIRSIETLNKTLEDKNRKLEEINEELTSFAFVASHDLREPLRKIQIFSDWLCKKETAHLSPDGLDRFNRIQAAVHRMDVLIDDILSFSRVNTSDKNFTSVELDQVMENVKSDLAETISQKRAVIESDPLPLVNGNPSQFAQLFQNMVSNALKYQPAGSIPHLQITCTHVAGSEIDHPAAFPDGNYIKVAFADNGIGFEEQYARKIFQMFQRLHGMNEYPGTGMGLAICKKIVEHHNGFIIAKSKPGEGSVFECYFPAE